MSIVSTSVSEVKAAARKVVGVVVACFGITIDEASEGRPGEWLEQRGLNVVWAEESHVVSRAEEAYCRRAGKEPREECLPDNLLRQAKARGATRLIVFAKRCPMEAALLMGEAVEAGMQVEFVELRHGRLNPATQRMARGKPTQQFDAIPGHWRKIGGGAWRFVEERYDYHRLATTRIPVGELWVFKPSDYEGCERWVQGKGWVPVSPPEGVEYPHVLNLASGFTFSEVSARWADWLWGQGYTWGELRQKLRQWLAQSAIREELRKYELVQPKDCEGSCFQPTGYYVRDEFVSSGTSGKPARKKEFGYGKPVWLATRPRWQDADPMPSRWRLTEWGFDDESDGEEVKLREEYELAGDEDAPAWRSIDVQEHAYRCLKEGLSREYASLEKAMEAAREMLRYERMLTRPWEFRTRGKGWMPRQERRLEGERAEENAWLEGTEILAELERIADAARACEDAEEVGPEPAENKRHLPSELKAACDRVTLPLKRLIVKPRGKASRSLLDELREAKRRCEEAIADARSEWVEDAYDGELLAEALNSEEAKPGWALLAYRERPQLLETARRLVLTEAAS